MPDEHEIDLEKVLCPLAAGQPHAWENRDDGYDATTGESFEVMICARCGATIDDVAAEVHAVRR